MKLEEGLKDEYKSLSDLVKAVPDSLYLRKFKKDKHTIIFIYQSQVKNEQHISDLTAIFVEYEGKFRKVEQQKLREELAKILIKNFSVDKFMDDFLNTLLPEDIFEAYTRAVIKKGKVKEKEGCYKFLIYGQKGRPMELMLRN